jgi:hypothetical protein
VIHCGLARGYQQNVDANGQRSAPHFRTAGGPSPESPRGAEMSGGAARNRHKCGGLVTLTADGRPFGPRPQPMQEM